MHPRPRPPRRVRARAAPALNPGHVQPRQLSWRGRGRSWSGRSRSLNEGTAVQAASARATRPPSMTMSQLTGALLLLSINSTCLPSPPPRPRAAGGDGEIHSFGTKCFLAPLNKFPFRHLLCQWRKSYYGSGQSIFFHARVRLHACC